MRRATFLLVLTSTLLGCSFTRGSGIPFTNLPVQVELEELRREEYQVGTPVEGADCAVSIALYPLPIWWASSDAVGTLLWSFRGAEGLARQGAIMKAMDAAPQADFLTAPRTFVEYTKVGPWFTEVCFEIKARAARVKRDDELPIRDVEVELDIKDTLRGVD